MAAAMSTADGLVLAISNCLSHDIYYKIIDPKADVKKANRCACTSSSDWCSRCLYRFNEINKYSGSSSLGIRLCDVRLILPTCTWCMVEGATKEGAVAGILGGLISGTAYLIYVGPKFMAQTPWLGIDHLRFGIIGASVSLVAMVVVSLMTKELIVPFKKWLMTLEYLAEELFLENNTK